MTPTIELGDTDEPRYGIGVDVGGTTTRVVVFDGDDRARYTASAATPAGPDALVEHLARAAAEAVDSIAVAPDTIGVGIPGGVRDGVVTMAVNLGIDEPLALGRILADRLDVPVVVENDVDAAALGARTRLGADAGRSMTYLSIGTGFAAGTIIDGRLVRGGSGLAGEIGHIPLPGHVDPCACGQVGCIETIVSGQALVTQMTAADIGATAIDLWLAADDGRDAAIALRDDFVAALAWSAQLAVMLLDVDRVVVGGGVGIALGDRLVGRVRECLARRETTSPLLRKLAPSERVIGAPAGVELGALGAHLAARDGVGSQEVGS